MYRVMLHNDTMNKREYVVAVIMRVVKSLSVDDAVNIMQARARLRALQPAARRPPPAAHSVRCSRQAAHA